MEIRREITIAKDRLAVWRHFADPEKRRRWQKGLSEIEYIYGEAGKPGSVTQYIFRRNGGSEVIEETVLERQQPSLFIARYHSSKDARLIEERFESIGGNQTRWVRGVAVRPHSLVARLVQRASRGGLGRVIEAEMERFKQLVEGGG